MPVLVEKLWQPGCSWRKAMTGDKEDEGKGNGKHESIQIDREKEELNRFVWQKEKDFGIQSASCRTLLSEACGLFEHLKGSR